MAKKHTPQKGKDNEKRLSILSDIEKSATIRLEQYADISAKVTEPLIQSGVLTGLTKIGQSTAEAMAKLGDVTIPTKSILGITDATSSVRAIQDLATSPVFTQAAEALAETRRINEQITSIKTDFIDRMPDLTKFAEAMQSVTEPIVRLQETASVLNRVHNFDVSIMAVTEAYDAVSTKPWITEREDYITYRPPQSQIVAAVSVLSERVDNLADEISEKVEQKFEEKIDILIQKRIIPVGIKQANCYCPKCDKLLFKVEDMSHFMRGSHKCVCGETLQIPRDLKIVPL
jgi:hypothetical protein